MTRKSFVLHIDSLDVLDELSNEQAGMLLKAMHSFHIGDETKLDTLTKIIFSPFKNQFFRDNEKYLKTCEKRAESGSIGGRSSKRESGIDNSGENQLYVLRLYNESEDFIKIGTTTNRINRRFSGAKNMPYEYEIVHQLIGVESSLEASLQASLTEFTYVPLIKFPGHTECFSRDCLDKLTKLKLFAQAKCSKAQQSAPKLAESVNVNVSDNKSVNESESDNKSVSVIKDMSPKVDVNLFLVDEIFQHWVKVMCKGNRTSLTKSRKAKISSRLKDGYPSHEIKQAIDNVAKDSFLVAGGHTDIEMICRSDTNLEKYRDASNSAKPVVGKTQEIFNQLSEINYDRR
jgi:hypothetical protein